MSAAPPPVLTTRRVRLRLATTADAEGLLRYQLANREHLAPFEPLRPPGFFTAAYWRQCARRNAREYAAGASFKTLLFLRDGPGEAGDPIGMANLNNVIRGVFHSCFLGFSLGREHQGEGLMREVLEALIRHAFDEMKLHRISANYMPHNLRSGGLLRRLGFTAEGYARDYLRIAGRWEDHVLTSLLNPRWSDAAISGRAGARPDGSSGRRTATSPRQRR